MREELEAAGPNPGPNPGDFFLKPMLNMENLCLFSPNNWKHDFAASPLPWFFCLHGVDLSVASLDFVVYGKCCLVF